MRDLSNGYEALAETFIRSRNGHIGPGVVGAWAKRLRPGAEVLELGCGHGVVSQALADAGCKLYAIDASPTLLRAFRERFPSVPTECAAAEESTFFGRKFDGIVAWGLIFLLEEEAQRRVMEKAALALAPGGQFFFTAPRENVEWIDVLTDQLSRSLGVTEYTELLESQGLRVSSGEKDEGGNHYICAARG